MYWNPTLTSLRSPASVIAPGVAATSSRSPAVDRDVVAPAVDLVGPVAEHGVELLAAAARRCPGARPRCRRSPSVASRSLSSRTPAIARSFASGSFRDGISAAMPPIACAPRRWHVRTSSSVYARMNGTVIFTSWRSGVTNSGRSRKHLIVEKM